MVVSAAFASSRYSSANMSRSNPDSAEPLRIPSAPYTTVTVYRSHICPASVTKMRQAAARAAKRFDATMRDLRFTRSTSNTSSGTASAGTPRAKNTMPAAAELHVRSFAHTARVRNRAESARLPIVHPPSSRRNGPRLSRAFIACAFCVHLRCRANEVHRGEDPHRARARRHLVGFLPAVNVLLGERSNLPPQVICLAGGESECEARGPQLPLPLGWVLPRARLPNSVEFPFPQRRGQRAARLGEVRIIGVRIPILADVDHSPGPFPPRRTRDAFDVPGIGEGAQVKRTVRSRAAHERSKLARRCRAFDGEAFKELYS